jgi:hypothetical protein
MAPIPENDVYQESDPMAGLSWNWAALKKERCEATNLIRDDRLGGFRDRCELLINHAGPHAVKMTACVPLRYGVWWDDV